MPDILSDVMAQREALRELHKPEAISTYQLVCMGCDFEWGPESGPAEWPCQSADIVFTAEELFEYGYGWSLFQKWYRQWYDRQPRRGSTGPSWIQQIYSEQIRHQLSVPSIFTRFNDKMAGQTSEQETGL